jgi:glycerate kinase
MSMKIVVAPDSFKGTLSARGAAEAIALGWTRVHPGDEIVLLPQADGGEGTLDAVEAAVPSAVRRSAGEVTGPDGSPTPGEWLELPGGIAVVELAQASGLPLMAAADARGATTRGLGQVLRAAVENGATSVIVGLGGSASTDGGAGALAALGLRLSDAAGADVPDGGAALAALHSVDTTGLVAPPAGGVALLSDVDAPLLGPRGAAAVFGPQKGASAADVVELDAALARFAAVLGGDPGAAGAGAAGGTGFGLATAWGATLESGADYIAALSGIDDAIAGADLLLLGEGRFDSQSLGGKVVGQLLARAAASGVPVGVIAGQVDLDDDALWTVSLSALAGSAAEAMAEPETWLHAAGAAAPRHFATHQR